MSGLLAALALGYLLGRARPWKRFVDWNWARAMWHPQTLRDGALWIVLHPVKAAHTWRRRNEPRRLTVDAADLFQETP